MKRILIALIILTFAMPVLAISGPALPNAAAQGGAAKAYYLVCDPQTGVEFYRIIDTPAGGTPVTTDVPATATGGLDMNIMGIANGTHGFTQAPCNGWGCGETTPVTVTKSVPGKSQNVKVVYK